MLTVPLGSLAGAYLEALAALEDDRMGNVIAFVAVASQLILIKSPRAAAAAPAGGRRRARRRGPRPRGGAAGAADPVPRVPRRRRRGCSTRRMRGSGCSIARRPTARSAGLAGARPPAAAPLSTQVLVDALDGLARVAPPPPPPPETIRRTVLAHRPRAAHPPGAPRARTSSCSRTCWRACSDRVVVAVTFLAMLELMKRREIVVEQAEPWGPIMARRTTPEERAAAGVPGAIDEEAPLDESLESFA